MLQSENLKRAIQGRDKVLKNAHPQDHQRMESKNESTKKQPKPIEKPS